ncbi:hypothetical protein F0L68_09940 [Solihabitans fulvus]|uniref:Intracellular septation protein A n=1 Tax=Solihabitans fulvus TaxID=1892852 RepID=A0A5B2XJZ9_9PSEU|nr:hypothetical protein [Solihabitans fulvus]KAA2263474.1 hypothetical protein F0L68_09940 [Solihabitans fulvus]
MSYLLTFLPWIVYAVVPTDHWQWGALAALVVAVGVIARQLRTGRSADALIIELGSAAFFAVLTVIAFTNPDSAIHPYSPAISAATLGLIAGVSLAIRRPFTLGIAKQSVPREFWTQPLFVRANVIITSVWTAAFVASAVALGLITHAGGAGSAVAIAVQLAGFVLPMVFTIRYSAAVRARAAKLTR